jgi:hypothetical protein
MNMLVLLDIKIKGPNRPARGDPFRRIFPLPLFRALSGRIIPSDAPGANNFTNHCGMPRAQSSPAGLTSETRGRDPRKMAGTNLGTNFFLPEAADRRRFRTNRRLPRLCQRKRMRRPGRGWQRMAVEEHTCRARPSWIHGRGRQNDAR